MKQYIGRNMKLKKTLTIIIIKQMYVVDEIDK